MKIIFALILLTVVLPLAVFAQCQNEPTIDNTNKILAIEKFQMNNTVEGSLIIEASAPGASWARKAAEAPVVTVFVDGEYNQDVVLFAGAERFSYRVFLGELKKGTHEIAVALNAARSAANANTAVVHRLLPGAASLDARVAPRGKAGRDSPDNINSKNYRTDFLAKANAPFIHARPNAVDKFTDIPLVTYYEVFDETNGAGRIRYTAIFSHEDGGTPAAALMARWGRVTDIEWVYEIKTKNDQIVSETYQGAFHQTKNFTGKRAHGSHPLIYTVTDNNNFADAGCSALRFAPLPVRIDLTNRSRETIMEEFPWTYRVMAEELAREERVNPAKLDADVIADPRDYLYVETETDLQNAAIAVEIAGQNNVKISSDANLPSLRMSRSGFQRIAVRLPPEIKEFPAAVTVRCHAANSAGGAESAAAAPVVKSVCRNVNVRKVVRLDRNFVPRERKLNEKAGINLGDATAAVFSIE